MVRFPDLGSDDVIVPGMPNLFFNIKLDSINDKNRTLVCNIGRAIIKKLVIKFERNETLSVNDFDVFVFLKTCGKQNRKKEMPLGKALFLMTVALRTVLSCE